MTRFGETIALDGPVVALLIELRHRMPGLTDHQRCELFAAIAEGYCQACGREDPKHQCPCERDE